MKSHNTQATVLSSRGKHTPRQKSYLLIEEFTGFLFDGVQILDLSSRETHNEGNTLGRGGVLVEVVTRWLCPLVDSLVYRFAEIYSLQTDRQTEWINTMTHEKDINIKESRGPRSELQVQSKLLKAVLFIPGDSFESTKRDFTAAAEIV